MSAHIDTFYSFHSCIPGCLLVDLPAFLAQETWAFALTIAV